jgi:hypothetical protein
MSAIFTALYKLIRSSYSKHTISVVKLIETGHDYFYLNSTEKDRWLDFLMPRLEIQPFIIIMNKQKKHTYPRFAQSTNTHVEFTFCAQ